jgi:hypothetical protein
LRIADPARSPGFDAWAQVHARDHVTRYLRRGAGRAVIALGDAAAADARWPELVEAIAGRFRAVLPETPLAGDFEGWLGGFVDGLGVAPTVVVAAGGRCPAALAFARLDAGRLARLVLLPADEVAAVRLGAAVAGQRPPVPVLLVPPDGSAADAVRRILAFLDEECASAG